MLRFALAGNYHFRWRLYFTLKLYHISHSTLKKDHPHRLCVYMCLSNNLVISFFLFFRKKKHSLLCCFDQFIDDTIETILMMITFYSYYNTINEKIKTSFHPEYLKLHLIQFFIAASNHIRLQFWINFFSQECYTCLFVGHFSSFIILMWILIAEQFISWFSKSIKPQA